MKILMLTEFFDHKIGGGEIWLLNVASKLAERGHKIIVLTYKKTNDNEKINNLIIKRIGFTTVNETSSYLTRAIIQGFEVPINSIKYNFDIILASHTLPLLPAKIVSLTLKKPLVAVFQSFWGFNFGIKDKGFFKGLIRGSIEKITLKFNYQKILTVSSDLYNKFIKNGVKSKISIVYGGVDLELIDTIDTEKTKKHNLFLGEIT